MFCQEKRPYTGEPRERGRGLFNAKEGKENGWFLFSLDYVILK
jgi:hypothetical protein